MKRQKLTLQQSMIRAVVMMCLCLALTGIRTTKVSAAAVFTDNKDGTVTMEFDNTYTVRIKLVVQLTGGKQYKYDIPKGESKLNIPLTQGNGKYKLMLCRNTTGSKYSVMQTENVELQLSDDLDAFLTSHYIIDWEDTNEAIKKAQKLTKSKKTPAKKLDAIYKYVVKNYSYDYDKAKKVSTTTSDMAYIPVIDSVLKEQMGICYDISVLMASMLRSVEIPARVVTGYTPNATTYHAWNSIYYEKQSKWRTVDATYDLQMYQAKRSYKMFKDDKDYSDIVYIY